jgi:hypothetical protein
VTAPAFKLFRSTSSANRCAYTGHVITPDGRHWLIDADVTESDDGKLDAQGKATGGKVKHFVGTVRAADMRALVRGAKATGKLPDDLVAAMDTAAEAAPFDDPLPQNMGQ